MITSEGFVLLSGASVNERTAPRSFSSGLIKLRDKHYKAGRIKDWKQLKIYYFRVLPPLHVLSLDIMLVGQQYGKNEGR